MPSYKLTSLHSIGTIVASAYMLNLQPPTVSDLSGSCVYIYDMVKMLNYMWFAQLLTTPEPQHAKRSYCNVLFIVVIARIATIVVSVLFNDHEVVTDDVDT